MILKLFTIIAITFVVVEARLGSRVEPKLACNCRLSEYARDESQLAYEYLDMSNYMAHDRVAFHGFHKMFRSYWKEQIENTHKVYEYALKRGDEPKILHFFKLKIRPHLNDTGPLHAVKATLDSFLAHERKVNERLLKLSKCSTNKLFQRQEDRTCKAFPDEDYEIDPMLANFIETNFLTQKVERIKYLADLITRISHFDKHINTHPHQHELIPLGLHLIDQELQQKF